MCNQFQSFLVESRIQNFLKFLDYLPLLLLNFLKKKKKMISIERKKHVLWILRIILLSTIDWLKKEIKVIMMERGWMDD